MAKANLILIAKDNAAEIEAALKEVNGKAKLHTFTTYQEIGEIAVIAEETIAKMLFKKDFSGAVFRSTSGDSVCNSYGNNRIATQVDIVRKKDGWYIKNLSTKTIGTAGGTRDKLFLTAKQDAAAKERFSRNWTLLDDYFDTQATSE